MNNKTKFRAPITAISVFVMSFLFLFQCSKEDEAVLISSYLEKNQAEQTISGHKLAEINQVDGTRLTFWEFEDAVALYVERPESAGAIDDSHFAPGRSFVETYRTFTKRVDTKTEMLIKAAERRAYDNGLKLNMGSVNNSTHKKTGDFGARTGISYGCAVSAAQNGAAHKSYWTRTAGYEYSNCEVNTDFGYAYGSDLTYVAVGIRVEGNSHATIERWNPSYLELVSSNVYKGTHYKWYISYSSNPVDYIAGYASPNSGVDCPKVHVCLAGDE